MGGGRPSRFTQECTRSAARSTTAQTTTCSPAGKLADVSLRVTSASKRIAFGVPRPHPSLSPYPRHTGQYERIRNAVVAFASINVVLVVCLLAYVFSFTREV